jgi:8-hydroxy-5-deazaflavin:NADPH oxidoreductase
MLPATALLFLASIMVASLSTKTIAIIGGGSVGSTIAASIASSPSSDFAPKKLVIGARDPAKTKAELAAKQLGHLLVEPLADAIAAADILILTVPGGHSDEDIEKIAKSLGGGESVDDSVLKDKIVIDATNPLSEFSDGLQVRWTQGGTSGAEVLQNYLPASTKVYKAFNTLGVELMRRDKAVGTLMLFCGPDNGIQDVVAAVGFTPRYVGPLRYARNLEAMAELWIHCAIPPLPGHYLGRDWSFAIAGNPEE